MNCTCLNELPEKIKNNLPEETRKGKTVKSVKIQSFLSFSSMTQQTYSEMYVTLEGLKKEVTISLNHNFCPFCGIQQTEKIPITTTAESN